MSVGPSSAIMRASMAARSLVVGGASISLD